MAAPVSLRLAEAIELRPYQLDTIDRLRDLIRRGIRRVVLVAPTGSGKTVMASSMIKSAVARGSRVMFIAHRKELIDQAHSKLGVFGVSAGVMMGGDRRADSYLPVQVCSIQTLTRRLDRLPPAQLVIYDEAHHSLSGSARRVLEAYPEAVTIGLTATPWRTDKIGLADLYQSYVLAATPRQLIEWGALVDYDAYAYDAPDLHEVKLTAGDYNQRDLAVACNTQVLVGSVVREYLAHAAPRPGILFPVNIAHSLALVDEFRSAGVNAVHIDCDTPKIEREAAINGLRNGGVRVLSSVGVLTEGFDAPAAEVCMLARPTQSLTLHLQMIGRVLRPAPGKSRALIHDHAGNLMRHGFPDDDRDYSLTATPSRTRALHTCPLCHHVFGQLRDGKCPGCGELIVVPDERQERGDREDHVQVEGRRISKAEIAAMRERRAGLGLTRELTDAQLARAARATRQEKAAEYLRLKAVAERKGFKPGFVSHQYREVFGCWPKFADGELDGIEPAERPFVPLAPRKQGVA